MEEVPLELADFADVIEGGGDEPVTLTPFADPRIQNTITVRPGPFARSRVRYWKEAETQEHKDWLEEELADVQTAWRRHEHESHD